MSLIQTKHLPLVIVHPLHKPHLNIVNLNFRDLELKGHLHDVPKFAHVVIVFFLHEAIFQEDGSEVDEPETP